MEWPGKRGDLPLHSAARGGNLNRVKEIIQESKEVLSKQNAEGETPLYVASENGHALVVSEMLQHSDLQIASIAARNGYDPFHVAAKHGHLGMTRMMLFHTTSSYFSYFPSAFYFPLAPLINPSPYFPSPLITPFISSHPNLS